MLLVTQTQLVFLDMNSLETQVATLESLVDDFVEDEATEVSGSN